MEEIKKAPIIYDTTFFNEMSKPIVRLPDLVPLTFNLQEDFVKKFPITSFTTDRDLESLKKEYLTIEGGIHQQTLPEISERFGVNIDFLGISVTVLGHTDTRDACCRLGAYVPIDLTKELRGIISYSAIWDLLQFLNICDPAQIELFYTNLSIKKIAKELNITLKLLYKFLDKLCIKLPFGINTRLNLTCLKYLELYTNHYKKKYLSTHESNEYTINGTTTKGIPNTEDISTLGPSTVTKGKGANSTAMECTTTNTITNESTNKSHINE
ncbi:uncharacterized protein TA08165 [Theileria annulata]|uniref:Uncharacterized protein n=1 Tax=Theileria annulata TaxID=5874 RepID=Q4UAJ9_THEAN|nr:uncharacterized protein TA08165 [Theileria annulata]CAI76152.1 hypothetical protein TA08165 [Theileria annulata]|eukprot:XP_952778.1 hypothetical protein TA08165 [Theileria annulata]